MKTFKFQSRHTHVYIIYSISIYNNWRKKKRRNIVYCLHDVTLTKISTTTITSTTDATKKTTTPRGKNTTKKATATLTVPTLGLS